jgi:hypothetical protein
LQDALFDGTVNDDNEEISVIHNPARIGPQIKGLKFKKNQMRVREIE